MSSSTAQWRKVIGSLVAAASFAGLVSALAGSPATAGTSFQTDPGPAITPGSGSIRLAVASALDSKVGGTPFDGLRVQSNGDAWEGDIARGDAIYGYQWLINADNTGDNGWDPANCMPASAAQPDTAYAAAGTGAFPSGCQNPSVHAIAGSSPVIASGVEGELDESHPLTLPNGKYLLSITAPGYKIDGVHFVVTNGHVWSSESGQLTQLTGDLLTASMNPMPLATLTVRVNIFEDNASTNGQWDGLAEHGLDGFQVMLNDVLGPVTTDVFGNPLCTEYYRQGHRGPPARTNQNAANYTALYDAWAATPYELDSDGSPLAVADTGGFLQGSTSGCVSKVDPITGTSEVAIPNMGPNRYAVTVSPPDAQDHIIDGRTGLTNTRWIQTTTLEGGHDWDSWNQEGGTGYDTERIVGNELTPPVDFGFVQITDNLNNTADTGSVEGVIAVARTYVPGIGGQANQAEWIGAAGTKIDRPISDGVVALSCLAGCGSLATDTAQYIERTDADGSGHFRIDNVPAGTWQITVWDESQSYILALTQIEVTRGHNSDIGTMGLMSWFTEVTGTVFLDSNGNGRQDFIDSNGNGRKDADESGEVGVPGYTVGVRTRSNSLQDQGQTAAATNDNGEYELNQVYPLGQFLILEAFNTRYKSTGYTYQADNQPTETTVISSQVDINVLPIIGLSGRLDWGVQPYGMGENGGIVGTVTYDSTRNEHNPAEAAAEDYQPSIPGITVNLYEVVPASTGCASTDASGKYCIDADGAFTKGALLDSTVTESWTRPTGCVARDVHGDPITFDKALPHGVNDDCLEAPMSGVQFGGEGTVDGNYGFDVPSAEDYLVEVVSPKEEGTGRDRPLYKVTDEESINVFTGDVYAPQGGWAQQATSLSTTDPMTSLGGWTVSPAALWSTTTGQNPQLQALRVNTASAGSGSAVSSAPVAGGHAQVQLGRLAQPSSSCTSSANNAPAAGLIVGASTTAASNYFKVMLCTASGQTQHLRVTQVVGGVSGAAQDLTLSSNATRFQSGDHLKATVTAANGGGFTVKVDKGTGNTPTFTQVGAGPLVFPASAYGTTIGAFAGVRAENLGTGSTSRVLFDNFSYDAPSGVNGGGDPIVLSSGDVRGYTDTASVGPVAQCAGALGDAVNTKDNDPDFYDGAGGSLFEGKRTPSCDTKLVTVRSGRSVAPTFHMYTDVPIPTRFFGLTINDLTISTDPRSIWFGEMAGIANQPIGVYDEAGQLKYTTSSDYNGVYEILLPSTDTYNCPLPAGPCPNVYRLVANDPGQVGSPNTNYNPVYRTIATNFQGWPGVVHPVDQAPTAATTLLFSPGSQTRTVPECAVSADTPKFYRVTDPVVARTTTAGSSPLTIAGASFGSVPGTVRLTSSTGVDTVVPTSAWIDTQIVASIPNSMAGGRYSLSITGANGLSTVNAITISLTGNGYTPVVLRVGSDQSEIIGGTGFNPNLDPADGSGPRAIQRALDRAALTTNGDVIVVVDSNQAPAYQLFNPNFSYFENIVVHSSNVKLQGVGPGGPGVPGATIDASSFWGAGVGDVDGVYAGWWHPFVDGLAPSAAPVPDGEGILVIAPDRVTTDNQGNQTITRQTISNPAIDGLGIIGGIQQGFPNTIKEPGVPGAAVTETQGGGVFVNRGIHSLTVSNNVIDGNGGAYGGGIRVGTPEVGANLGQPNGASNDNTGLKITHNRILHNGGSFLAGGIGLFNGTTGYNISGNDLCGNFSTEYGGAISHYGLSDGGVISHNRIWFNSSYDEGGAVFIGGELPGISTTLTSGAGAVTVDANLIQGNLSNDDGGGLRFLMGTGRGHFATSGNNQGVITGTETNNYLMTVTNNIIANNVATHEGGGMAIDDTPNIVFANNTVVRNITTATASTSDGLPAPAGLATGANSALLNSRLPSGSLTWSKPTIVNSIFADNRAGTWSVNGITGIGKGIPGDTGIVNWDMGASDGSGPLTPTNSSIQDLAGYAPGNRIGGAGYAASPTNSSGVPIEDVGLKALFATSVDAFQLRTNTNFTSASLIVVDLPINQMGDYHLATRPFSPEHVYNLGANVAGTIPTTLKDVDGDARSAPFDIGADEIPPPTADLSITKTDNVSNAAPGATLTYTIVVSNAGPTPVTAAPVTDTFPAGLTVTSWTCTATAGNSCAATGTGSNRTGTVTLANGGSATFTGVATVDAGVNPGSLTNTATVAAPAGVADPNTGNNIASDVDQVPYTLPTLGLLDNFNRGNANTLGGNWSQAVLFNSASLRVNANQASANTAGVAYWNVPGGGFGAKQGAAFTVANTTFDGDALVLKAGGTTFLGTPQNFIRVRYSASSGGQVIVEGTSNFGISYTNLGSFAGTLANGDTLSAVAYANGALAVFKTAGTTTTFIGATGPSTSWTAGGRIGMQLPTGARIDNFNGGTVTP